MLVVAPFLLWSQFHTSDNKSWQAAVTGAVAALVGMVPEGLVLLTSLAFTVATVTLARKQTLVQQLPAVEGLARVDVVCLDKTGTLTHGDIVFDRLQLLEGADEADVRQALALSAHGPDTNATSQALAAEFADTDWTRERRASRSPRRASGRRSAPTDHGTLGARRARDGAAGADRRDASRGPRPRPTRSPREGQRVLLLAQSRDASPAATVAAQLPGDLMPRGAGRARRADPRRRRRKRCATSPSRASRSRSSPATTPARSAPSPAGSAFPVRTRPPTPSTPATCPTTSTSWPTSSSSTAFSAGSHRSRSGPSSGAAKPRTRRRDDGRRGERRAGAEGRRHRHRDGQRLSGDPGGGRNSSCWTASSPTCPTCVAEGRRVIANIERAANLFLVKNVYSLVLALIAAVDRCGPIRWRRSS